MEKITISLPGDLSTAQGCAVPHTALATVQTPPAIHTQRPAGSSHLAPAITPPVCAYLYLDVKQHGLM